MAWAPNYVDVAALARFLRIGDGGDDPELAVAVSAASRAIDDHCNRQFGQVDVPEQRFYTARYDYERCWWVVPVDDFMTTVGASIAIGSDPVTLYAKQPANAAAEGRPWTRIVIDPASSVQPTGAADEVAATIRWGWTVYPARVVEATFLQASRLHSRRESPFGIAGSPQQGSELRLLARLDPDVAVLLGGRLIRRRKVA